MAANKTTKIPFFICKNFHKNTNKSNSFLKFNDYVTFAAKLVICHWSK